KAPVTETTWNLQRRRKRTLNTKQTFWNDNAAEQAFNKLTASETESPNRARNQRTIFTTPNN
ncbi:hypothetical protein CGJ24_24370, partial [Vibrio parahaemolyticus]